MRLRFLMPVVVLLCPPLGSLWGIVRAAEPSDPAPDRVKEMRAKYLKVSPEAIKIKEPVRVEQCAFQRVPVAVILFLHDADDVSHVFMWWLDKGKFSTSEYDHIYWTYWKEADQIRHGKFDLKIRGPEESALYGLMLRWAADKQQQDELSLFDKDMLELVSDLLVKLDQRFAAEPAAGDE